MAVRQLHYAGLGPRQTGKLAKNGFEVFQNGVVASTNLLLGPVPIDDVRPRTKVFADSARR